MSLTFDQLRDAIVPRCEEHFTKLSDWSPAEWGCALAGEVGELCNLLKKQLRGKQVPLQDLADELADVVCYADLLAARLGINLGEAVREKFNQVSVRKGATERL